MHEEFSIRTADESDLEEVLRLLAQPAMDDGRVLSLQQARVVFSEMCRVPNYRLYVAVQGHSVVGMFALLIMPNLGHMGTPSGVLEDIVVADGWHGTGIGRRMVGHAIELCRAKGCYKMVLSSNLRRKEAHAFYEHLGFERHGYSYRIQP
jgi:GNAT superfamily N-acetyltransferase